MAKMSMNYRPLFLSILVSVIAVALTWTFGRDSRKRAFEEKLLNLTSRDKFLVCSIPFFVQRSRSESAFEEMLNQAFFGTRRANSLVKIEVEAFFKRMKSKEENEVRNWLESKIATEKAFMYNPRRLESKLLDEVSSSLSYLPLCFFATVPYSEPQWEEPLSPKELSDLYDKQKELLQEKSRSMFNNRE